MCLWDQGIVDDNGNIGRLRQARRTSDNDRGVGRGRGIEDAYEGSETMTEALGGRRRARLIYNNYGGVGRGG